MNNRLLPRDRDLLSRIAGCPGQAARVADLFPGIVPMWVSTAVASLESKGCVVWVRVAAGGWVYEVTAAGLLVLGGGALPAAAESEREAGRVAGRCRPSGRAGGKKRRGN